MSTRNHRMGASVAAARRQRLALLALAAGSVISAAAPALAATIYWDGNGSSTGTWSNSANWDSSANGLGGNIAAPGVSDTAWFNASTLTSSASATIQLNLSPTVGGLVFANTGTTLLDTDAVSNRTLTIGTSGLTINSGAGAVTLGTTVANHQIALVLAGTQAWTNNSSNTLVLNNNNSINLGANALTFTGSADFTTGTGVISGVGGSIIKTGTDTLTLGAANTFTGGVTIKAGTVIGTGNAAAFGTGTITLGDATTPSTGASLFSGAITSTNPISVISNTNGGVLSLSNDTNGHISHFGGTVTLNSAPVTIVAKPGGTGTIFIDGAIGSTGTGNNVTVDNGSTTAGVSVTIASINSVGTFTNGGAGTGQTTFTGIIGSNVSSVTENSPTSTLNLAGVVNAFGALNVKNGTVVGGGDPATFGAGQITLGSDGSTNSATLQITSSKTYANPIVIASGDTGALRLTGAAGNPNFSGGIAFGSTASTLTLGYSGSSIATISGPGITGTGNLVISSSGATTSVTISAPVNNIGTITNSGPGTSALGTTISGNIGSNVTSVTQNSGTSGLTLSGTNSAFAGSVAVQAGTLKLGASALNNVNNSVSISSGATLDLNDSTVMMGGLNDGSGSGSVTNVAGANASTITLGNASNFTFNGNLTEGSNTAGMAITKTGTGSQTLGGTNVWSGTTQVNAGTLNITGSASGLTSHTAGQKALLVNGTSLGSTTSGVGRLTMSATPTLIGTTDALSTGINSSVKNTKIVPYLVGETTTTTGGLGTNTGTANTFLTYSSGTGLRPLNLTDEFDSWSGSISTSGSAGNNVRIGLNNTAVTATDNVATLSINSLMISSATANALTIAAGKTLTVTSGAILINANSTTSIAGSGTLDFGSAEASIYAVPTTTIATPITLSSGALTRSGAGNLTLSGQITTTGNLTLSNPGTQTLTASGGVISSGASNLTIKASSTGAITIGAVNNSGTITNSGSGSAGVTFSSGTVIGSNVTGITQNSPGTLTINGVANTFVGPVNVLTGTLTLNTDGSLGAVTNGVTLNNNATLIPIGVLSARRTITLNNGGSLGTGVVASTVTGTGLLTINGTSTLSGNNSYSNVTLAGNSLRFSSEANLGGAATGINFINSAAIFSVMGTQFTGFGAHAVTFANGSSGSLTMDIQDPTNTFTMDRNDTVNINSNTATALVKSGSGTFDVQSAMTTNNSGPAYGFWGGTFLVDSPKGGNLNLQKVSFQNNGTLKLLGKTDAAFTLTLSGIGYTSGTNGVMAGGGNIVVDNNASSFNTALDLGTINLFTLNGGSLGISTTNLGTGNAFVKASNVNDASGILTIGAGHITYTPAGGTTGFAYNTGSGTIGAYLASATLPTSGSVSTTNYKVVGSLSPVGTESANTLAIATTGAGQALTQTPGTTLTLTTGGLLFTGSNNYSISGGTLASATATTSDLIVNQYGSGALTIGSVIANGIGVSTLTEAGPGTLILTAANTYTGTTYVNGGVLSISNNNQLGPVATGAQLNLNGGTLQVTSSLALDNAGANKRPVVLGGSGGTFDVANGQTLTVTGVISGGGLTINNSDGGTGTVLLSAANTFSGGLWINNGIVKLNTASALLAASDTLTFGSGTTAKLQLNGIAAAFAGLTSSSANAVIENSHASNAAVLSVYNGADNVYAGTLQNGGTGTLGLTKDGGLKLTLTGNNTYTGPTTINGGILAAGALNTLSSGSDMTVSGGTLDASGYSNKVKSLNITAGGLNLGFGKTLSATNAVALNGTITIGGTASNAVGLYTLIDGGAGQFTDGGTKTVTNPNANFVLKTDLTNGDLLYQQKGSFGTIIATPTASDIITGGSTPFTFTVQNNAPSGSSSLGFSASALSGTTGSVTGPVTVTAGGTSAAQTMTFTGTTVGTGTQGTFTVTDGSASTTSATGSVTVNVYDHAAGTLTSGADFGSVITGGTVASQTAAIGNSTGHRAGLQITDLGGLTDTGSGLIAAGTSRNLTAAVSTGTVGVYSQAYTVKTSDDTSLNGHTTAPNMTFTVTGDVWDHASVQAVTPTQIDFGNVHQGYTGPISGLNPVTVTAATGHRVDLNGTGGTSGNINLGNLAATAPGASNGVTATLATGQVAGPITGSALLVYADASSLPGNNTVGSSSVTFTGNVYTGQSTWNGTANSNWSNFSNWDTAGGVPGIDGALSANDTATIGTTNGTVNLDVPASIKSLSFTGSGNTLSGGPLTITGSGAVISASADGNAISSNVTLGSATNVTVSNSGETLTISGNISGSGLTKLGAGKLVLTGTNTYGGTTIDGGQLDVTGSGSITGAVSFTGTGSLTYNSSAGAPTVTVPAGGFLGGTGTFSSITITAGGTLSPGNSPGTMTVTGLTDVSGVVDSGTLVYDIGSPNDRVNTDSLNIGTLTFADFTFNQSAGFGTGVYTLFASNSLIGSIPSGTASGPILGALPGATGTLSLAGNDVLLTVTIPEPSTVAMVLGLSGLFSIGRRRRRA